MKKLFLLFFIFIPFFEYAMQRMPRPLAIAARNRQLQRPHAPTRHVIIAHFIDGQWRERIFTKQPKEKPNQPQPDKEPFLKYPGLEKKTRVKREKPWRKKNNGYEETCDGWCNPISLCSECT